MMRQIGIVVTAALLLVVAPVQASGPPEGGWLGQRVVTKQGTVLRDKKPAADNEAVRLAPDDAENYYERSYS